MFDALAEHITGYPGFAIACASCGIILPLPEDVPLIWAGMRIAAGQWTWAPTLTAALVGVQLRDWAAWAVGRALGETVLDSPWVTRVFGRRRLARAQRLVREHGALAVLAGRFFVGFRTPVFLMAGAMRLPFRQFARWDALGLVLTVPIVILLGYELGQPLLDGARWAMARARFAAVAVALLGGAWLLWQNRPRDARETTPEVAPEEAQ
ncbi:MAG: DedA family protein [Deltaproteobacteria bacterium]|nr:DedA family protein [Deltaproteobacteria bacterium]